MRTLISLLVLFVAFAIVSLWPKTGPVADADATYQANYATLQASVVELADLQIALRDEQALLDAAKGDKQQQLNEERLEYWLATWAPLLFGVIIFCGFLAIVVMLTQRVLGMARVYTAEYERQNATMQTRTGQYERAIRAHEQQIAVLEYGRSKRPPGVGGASDRPATLPEWW